MNKLRRDLEYISMYVDERIRIVEFIFYSQERKRILTIGYVD
jgi:hypothetical protein